MTLPIYAEWPIFKQLFWLFGHMINGIYNALDWLGIANMGAVIIIATIFFQLLFLPSHILGVISGRKNKLKTREKNELLFKYKDNMATQEGKAAFAKENEEIEKRYKRRKKHGCLFAIFRFVILFSFLNVMGFASVYINALSQMDPEQLEEVFTFCGVYLLQSPKSNYSSLIIIPLLYSVLQFTGDVIRFLLEKRDSKKYLQPIAWMEDEKTELEKEVEAEEKRMRKKGINPQVVSSCITFAVLPLINFWFASITHATVGIYLITGAVVTTAATIVTTIICHKKMQSKQIAFSSQGERDIIESEESLSND